MRIWIDLANSPQVLFFRPIISELEQRGHSLTLTSRYYAQTVQLADQFHLRHTPVGGHGGKQLSRIGMSILERAWRLVHFGRRKSFDLAVSHNSYAQALAARALCIPFITLMDYEHQPLNHICFRLAQRVIVPDAFPQKLLHKYGATGKVVTFPGVKEQVYLADFVPQQDYRKKENLPSGAPLVVIRPPAPWTAYHHFQNDLFDELLSRLASNKDAFLLFLPRVPAQAESVRSFSNIRVAAKVYDGPNLMYSANLVISGGGTMNREAAVLGTPTYTIFKGKLGAVDRYLIDRGRMTQLQTSEDLSSVHVASDGERQHRMLGNGLVSAIADDIVASL